MALPVIELGGSPQQIGREHGVRLRAHVADMVEQRMQRLTAVAGERQQTLLDAALEVGRRVWDLHEAYDPNLMEELAALAEAARVDPLELLVANGDADLMGLLSDVASAREETAFWTGRNVSPEGTPYVGQTRSAPIGECVQPVVLRLYPDDAPAALVISVAGSLGLAGMNEAGLAIVANNLVPTDAQDGVTFVFVLRKALRQLTLENAIRVMLAAPRCSGHNYLIADATGRAVNVETSAAQASLTLLESGFYAHTNHFVSQTLQALERVRAPESMLSSRSRLRRARALLEGLGGHVTRQALQGVLADHESTPGAICQHGTEPGDMATCLSLIFAPQDATLWVAADNPCRGRFQKVQL